METTNRVYMVLGPGNWSRKEYTTLEEAIKACKKYNKKVKHPRYVGSGIPTGKGCYRDWKEEWKP